MAAVKDARGRAMRLDGPARRIVSLVPSLTEWLVTVGVGERLVGVTDWCTEPPEAVAPLAKVRGTKNPDIAAVVALEPDLVVANAEENRKIDVERLEDAGVAVFVTMPVTVAGAVAALRDVARAVGALPGAPALDADLVRAVRRAYADPPARRVRYACAVWRDPWMWIGRQTYAADLLGLAGGTAVFDDPATRYPKLELAAIADRSPEVIVLPREPFAFGARDRDQVLECCPRAELVDGKAVTWYGPRIPGAIRELRNVLRGS